MDVERLRRILWEEMLCADMRANYFAELLRRYQSRDKWVRVAVLTPPTHAQGGALRYHIAGGSKHDDFSSQFGARQQYR